MAMLGAEVVARTREILAGLREPVRIVFFTRETECHACRHVAAFLAELAALSPLLQAETRDFQRDRELADALGVHHVPAMVLGRVGDGRYPVRSYGLPSGLEFGAFLKTLLVLSTGKGMEGVDTAAVAGIVKEHTLKVFVLAA